MDNLGVRLIMIMFKASPKKCHSYSRIDLATCDEELYLRGRQSINMSAKLEDNMPVGFLGICKSEPVDNGKRT